MIETKCGITVIICCYNSTQRLFQTLKHLSQQRVSSYIPWEILIVNNASTDDTGLSAAAIWKAFGLEQVSLRVIDEDRPGLSYAREKGIKEAEFEYIIFCDDDNWLSEEYVSIAFKELDGNPKIGILGGFGIPKCEINAPSWFNDFAYNYATGLQNGISGKIESKMPYVYGAGAICRKSAMIYLFQNDFKSITLDRTGRSLSSGGDVEICFVLTLIGYEIWFNKNLQFFHFIPNERLNLHYLACLQFNLGYTGCYHLPYKWIFSKKNIPSYKLTWWWNMCAVFIFIVKYPLFRLLIGVFTQNARKNRMDLINNCGYLCGIIRRNVSINEDYLSIMKSRYLKQYLELKKHKMAGLKNKP